MCPYYGKNGFFSAYYDRVSELCYNVLVYFPF